MHTVAAIGIGDDPSKRSWIGTGFVFGDLITLDVPDDQKRWRVWLITNKHVIKDLKAVYVKFNSAVDPHSKDYAVPLVARNGNPYWVGSPQG